MKNHENRISNNVKPISNKLTVLKISPTKPSTGAIRKSKSDLQKVSKNFQNFINLSYLNYPLTFLVLYLQKTSYGFGGWF